MNYEWTRDSKVNVRLESMSDAELVVLCQRGNLQAFNSLVHKWDCGLYRFVRRMLGNAEDARDICQESLLKAYLNIGRLRDPTKFRAWLHHIALNLCRDWHRSAKNRVASQVYEEGQPYEIRIVEARGATQAPDRAAERASLGDVLNGVLARLSLEQRTAILLREYHGFASEEIAQITGVPATTVRTRIFYGLRSVRKMLREQGITSASFEQGAQSGEVHERGDDQR
jgi:RNA polymerase sigma-70 factor (ECF subfamily)